jgi:type I restriction enzyme S subunit
MTSAADRIQLTDVVERHQEFSREPSQEGFTRFLKVEHMDEGCLHLSRWGVIGKDELPPTFYNVFREGHVLFPSRNPHLRRTVWPDFDGICGEKTFVIKPREGLFRTLLPFILQSAAVVEHATRMKVGSTNPHVRWRDLASFKFALPDIEEQQRIAELLLATERMLNAISAVTRAAYSVWRSRSLAQFTPDDTILGESLGMFYEREKEQISPAVLAGLQLPLVGPEHIAKGAGCFEGDSIGSADGVGSNKFRFSNGSVLYSRIRPNFQKAVLVEFDGVCSTEIYPLRPKAKINGEYLLEVLLSPEFTRFALSGTKGTGFPRASHDHISRFATKIPSLSAQEEYLEVSGPLRRLGSVARGRLAQLTAMKGALLTELFSQ